MSTTISPVSSLPSTRSWMRRNFWFAAVAEVYLFGVAVDASGAIRVVPFGQAELDKKENTALFRSVREGEVVQFIGEGLALVLPPAKGFLALRLLIADSDGAARDAANVIKVVAEAVATKEAIALLVATGMPHAAAAAVVVGKALEAATKMMPQNKDDLIEAFEGYFTEKQLTRGKFLEVKGQNAEAVLAFV